MENKKVNEERYIQILDKRNDNDKVSVIISDRKEFGSISVLSYEDVSKIEFKKIDSMKELNLPYGMVEIIDGLFFLNKTKRRHFDLRTEEKKHLLVRIPITAINHIKVNEKVASTFIAQFLNFKIKEGTDEVSGYRFIIVPIGYKYTVPVVEEVSKTEECCSMN